MESRGADRREVIADCCTLAAIVFGVMLLTSWLGSERWAISASTRPEMLKPVGMTADGMPIVLLIEVATGLALVGYRRFAGVSGIAWITIFLLEVLNRPAWSLSGKDMFASDLHYVSFIVLPLACYAVMLTAPRPGPLHPRRIGWLFAALLLGGVAAPPRAPLEILPPLGLLDIMLLAALAGGIYLLTVDAWRPVAFALALAAFGLNAWTTQAPSIHDLHEYLYLGAVTVGPLLLLAGSTARLVSARREAPA